ncbi:hypothetical protein ACFPM0_24480 [Pseudonocardia sulfidoxydans]|uniref:hypothetical protein n=1 Tax=Pseudonocardia sulfidoxydans TaxID=54011 RepID=UPI00360C2C68
MHERHLRRSRATYGDHGGSWPRGGAAGRRPGGRRRRGLGRRGGATSGPSVGLGRWGDRQVWCLSAMHVAQAPQMMITSSWGEDTDGGGAGK